MNRDAGFVDTMSTVNFITRRQSRAAGWLGLGAFALCLVLLGHQTALGDDLCMFASDGVVTISNQKAGKGQRIACYKKRKARRKRAQKRRRRARKGTRWTPRKSEEFQPGTLKPLPLPVAESNERITGDLELSIEDLSGIHMRARKLGVLSGPPQALKRFNKALQAKRTGQRAEPVVVVQYGDSHSRASVFSRQLRSTFASGDFSPGYLQYSHPVGWNGFVKKIGRWKRANWMYGPKSAPFGPLGVAYWSRTPSAELVMRLKDKVPANVKVRVTVLFDMRPGHRPFFIESEGTPLVEVPTMDQASVDVDGSTLGAASVYLPAGHHSLSVRVGDSSVGREAEIRIFGFLVQYDDSPIEWDILGVGGSIVNNLLYRGDDTVETYLNFRKPDLTLIWFGSNSILEKRFDPKEYGEAYRGFLNRMKAGHPESSCIAVGPPDLTRRPDKTCFLTKRQRRIIRRGRRKARRKVWKHRREERICRPDSLVNHRKRGRYRFPVPEARTMKQWRAYRRKCQYKTIRLLEEMIDEQRKAAHEAGCLYFDMYRFMGGRESINRWACEAKPRLAWLDQIHLNTKGYQIVAAALGATMVDVMHQLNGNRSETTQE